MSYGEKMKKIILLLLMLFTLGGCSFKSTSLEDATIYTTVYPVEYIMNYLYGTESKVLSIYPSDVDLNNFKLTDKQIEEYASSDLFVYMGSSDELEIAKTFINENDKLLIIDATYGLTIDENTDIRSLWLAPNNFLMLAKNIKNSLNEYLNNTLKEEEVTKKYDELYAQISWVDAELRTIAKEAKENDNNTLVVASNAFKYLSNYGFNVISIPDIEKDGSENAINELKNNFKNGKYNTLLKLKSEEGSELVQSLVADKSTNLVEIDDMITNSDATTDYIEIQYENVATIRNLLVK